MPITTDDIRRFAPKKMTFGDVTKHAFKMKTVPPDLKKQALASLKAAGFDHDKSLGIINNHVELDKAAMKRVIGALTKNEVGQFKGHNSPDIVNKYVKSQLVKKRNIMGVSLERRLEADAAEDAAAGLGSRPMGPGTQPGAPIRPQF